MGLFSSHKTRMVDTDHALPGRAEAMAIDAPHLVLGTKITPPFPEGTEQADLRDGLLLGRGAEVLVPPWCVHDRRRLRGRDHAQPDVQRGLQREDRPRRSGPRCLRPGCDQLRRAARGLLRGARPDAGHATGQRRRDAVPLGHLHDDARAGRDRAQGRASVSRGRCATPATATSRPRSRPPGPSTTPSRITSSTSRPTPAGTAGSAAPVCRARSASAEPDDAAGDQPRLVRREVGDHLGHLLGRHHAAAPRSGPGPRPWDSPSRYR